MLKTLLSKVSFVLILNALIKPLWIFGVDRVFQNRVGSEVYGWYFSAISLTLILSSLLDLGITNHNLKHVAAKGFSRPLHFLKLRTKGFLCLLYFSILLAAGYLLSYNTLQLVLLLFMGTLQASNSLLLYMRSNFAGLQKFTLDSFFSVFDKTLVVLVLGGCFLWSSTYVPTIKEFVGVQLLGYTLALLLVFILSMVVLKSSFNQTADDFMAKDVLKQSYPYALQGILVALYFREDAVMLTKLIPNGDYWSGIYAQSFRIIDALSMIGYLSAGIFLPYFSKKLSQGIDLKPLLEKLFMIGFLAALFVVVVGWIYSFDIIGFLYDSSDVKNSAPVFKIVILSLIGLVIYYVFSTYLTAKAHIWTLNLIAFSGLLINFILNLLWIPKYQAQGAAWASVITQGLVSLLYIYFTYTSFSSEQNT